MHDVSHVYRISVLYGACVRCAVWGIMCHTCTTSCMQHTMYHACMSICTHLRVPTQMCACAYVCMRLHASACVCVRVRAREQLYSNANVRINTYTHTYTHTRTCTHTCTRVQHTLLVTRAHTHTRDTHTPEAMHTRHSTNLSCVMAECVIECVLLLIECVPRTQRLVAPAPLCVCCLCTCVC